MNNFGDLVKGNQSYKTPGTPNYGIMRPDTNDAKLNEKDEIIYWSAVGSLLQLVKHSRPDISNSVREISKFMDGATPAAMKELKQLLKFIIYTKDYGLKVEPIIDSNDK